MHVEAGFGSSDVRPLVKETGSGATAIVGITTRLTRSLCAALELAATTGGGGTMIEGPEPGDRSLSTILLGAEVAPRSRGPFAFLGAGVGRSTLSDARGYFDPPDYGFVPPRSLTAFAIGAGIGHRFAGGPGPLGFQLAFRTHALLEGDRVPASAIAITLGLAY
jgi:hypothetical protein